MLTNTIVETCSTPLTTAPRRPTAMALRLTAMALLLEYEDERMEESTTIGKPWVRPWIGQRENFGTSHTLKSLSRCLVYFIFCMQNVTRYEIQ